VESAVAAGAEAQAAQEALPVGKERAPPHLLRLRAVRRSVQPLVRRRHRGRTSPAATPALRPRPGRILAAAGTTSGLRRRWRRARGAEPRGESVPGYPGRRERPGSFGLVVSAGGGRRPGVGVARVGAAAATWLALAAVEEHVPDEHPPPGPARRRRTGRGRRRRGGGRGRAGRGGDRRRGLPTVRPRGVGNGAEIRRRDERIDQLEPRRRAAERGHGPRAAVHGRAPGREVAAARRRAAAHAAAVVVVVASGVEIRERGQGERADLAVVEELVGGDHGPARPAELELRVARAPTPTTGAGGRGGRARGREEEVVDGAGRRAEEVASSSSAAAADGVGTSRAGRRAGERGGAGAVDVIVHGLPAPAVRFALAPLGCSCSLRRVDFGAECGEVAVEVVGNWELGEAGERMEGRGYK